MNLTMEPHKGGALRGGGGEKYNKTENEMYNEDIAVF